MTKRKSRKQSQVFDNDGKYLEALCRDYVEALNSPKVWIHRLNDSAAARRLTVAQPADFIASYKWPFLLECKSVEHEYRLKKFVQHPRMARAAMAGFPGQVLVHHWRTDVYRVFRIEEIELGAPSHDLRGFEELNVEQALTTLFGR